MFISVVIPTMNRQETVKKCIAALASAKIPANTRIECIIVDNNSTDDTAKVVQELLPSLPFPARYVFHSKPGAASARNAGLSYASGDLLAFTDDDCYVDENWLVEIEKLFSQSENIDLAGGRVELYDANDCRQTIKTSTEPEFLTSAYRVRGFLHGCNMVLRRSLIEKIGVFDERFGAGAKLSAAEDTDLVYRAFKAGARLRYSPEFFVHHHHGRSGKREFEIVEKNYKIGGGALYLKHILSGNLDILMVFIAQMRPPLRRWIFGPERGVFIARYFRHLFLCTYLAVGAYKYLDLCFRGQSEPDTASYRAGA